MSELCVLKQGNLKSSWLHNRGVDDEAPEQFALVSFREGNLPPVHCMSPPPGHRISVVSGLGQAVGAPEKFWQKVAGRVPWLGKQSLALPPSREAEASVAISQIKGLDLTMCVGMRRSWGRTRAEQIAGKWRKAESVMSDGWEITAAKKDLVSACNVSCCQMFVYDSLFCFCLCGVKGRQWLQIPGTKSSNWLSQKSQNDTWCHLCNWTQPLPHDNGDRF